VRRHEEFDGKRVVGELSDSSDADGKLVGIKPRRAEAAETASLGDRGD
jgi:hypothetical protein